MSELLTEDEIQTLRASLERLKGPSRHSDDEIDAMVKKLHDAANTGKTRSCPLCDDHALERAAMLTPEGYRGVIADAVADDYERLAAENAALREALADGTATASHTQDCTKGVSGCGSCSCGLDAARALLTDPSPAVARVQDAVRLADHITATQFVGTQREWHAENERLLAAYRATAPQAERGEDDAV